MKNKCISFVKNHPSYTIAIITAISGLVGLSYENSRAKIIWFLTYKFETTIGLALAGLAVLFIAIRVIVYVIKNKKHEQVLVNGTKVILKTDTTPIMVVSKFNQRKNELLCTWNVKEELMEKWISQPSLKEYIYTPPATSQRRSRNDIW